MVHAAAELYLTTNDSRYSDFLKERQDIIIENAEVTGWIAAKAISAFEGTDFKERLKKALIPYREKLAGMSKKNPYGIPYRPVIFGAGWDIQNLAFKYYFLYKLYPDMFDKEFLENSLNFILGCHPGSNTASFASGVGAKSMTTAYGMNRADWSYIPGGVSPGTAIIEPDFPELMDFPFLWQQAEYVLGGGSSNYMFLVLAVQNGLKEG